jgi:hypothetical protein
MTRLYRRLMFAALAFGTVGLLLAAAGAGEIDVTELKEQVKKNQPYDPAIVPADFQDGGGQPLPIDNAYWPLVPGTTFVYEAETEDGLERNEVYVTHDTIVIQGVTCMVVWDREWMDEGDGPVLEESTFDWYAQDKDGKVWYFGEDSDGGGSWKAGEDGAKAGILMLANPQPGDTYRQEYYEGEAEDMAKVLRLNATVSVPYSEDDFEDCLVTKEWSPLEHGAVERKHYAAGVGLLLITELQGGQVHAELIEITTE